MKRVYVTFQRLNKAIDVLAPIKAAKSRIGLVQFSDDWRTKLEIYLGEKEKVGPNNVAIGPPNGVAFQSGNVDYFLVY